MPIKLLIYAIFLYATIAHAQNQEVLGEYKIGIIGRDNENPIYQAAHEGAKAASLDLSRKHSIDVELLVFTPDLSQGGDQTASLSEIFINNADGLIISPQDNKSVHASIEFALEQGKEIVYFERQLAHINPLAAVLADETEAGRLAGKEVLNKLQTKARIAILTSMDPGDELEKRLEGLKEVIGYRRIQTVVACEPNYRAAIKAINTAEEEDRNDQIKGWVLLDDWPLLGMPALPWDPGRKPVVAIQSSPTAFMYVDQGYIDALIVHPYYKWGYKSVETMIEKLHNQQSPAKKIMLTTPRVVNWQNSEEYRKDWQKWLM